MPEVSWKEIDDIIHEVKGILSKTAKVELLCKEIRNESLEELEKIELIIDRQKNEVLENDRA